MEQDISLTSQGLHFLACISSQEDDVHRKVPSAFCLGTIVSFLMVVIYYNQIANPTLMNIQNPKATIQGFDNFYFLFILTLKVLFCS